MVDAPFSSRARTLSALFLGAAALAAATPAQAAISGPGLIASGVANVAMATNCRLAGSASFATAQVAGEAALVSRARAKPLSALERMRMEQAGTLTASPPANSLTAAQPSYLPAIAARTLATASAANAIVPAALTGINCAQRFDPVRVSAATSRFDFLESRILPVSTTVFDSAWARISARSGGSAVRSAVLAADVAGGGTVDRIASVNSWVNRKVAYTADAKLYGKADYWASADETLAKGKGDCEDYAIAKMEILAAMGIARGDMYLTLARDLVRRDDHAVLIVKVDGRAIMLDNATDTLLDGDRANDYRPILSFNTNKSYLHGY